MSRFDFQVGSQVNGREVIAVSHTREVTVILSQANEELFWVQNWHLDYDEPSKTWGRMRLLVARNKYLDQVNYFMHWGEIRLL